MIETHTINNEVVTAIQFVDGVDLTEFLGDELGKFSDDIADWLRDLDYGMWLVKRGPRLVEMHEEVYQVLMRGTEYVP